MTPEPGNAIPLHAEELSVSKRKVTTGRVQVSRVTRRRTELVDEILARQHVEIERIPVGRPVESMPAVRREGDVIVVPVVEEYLVVERRLRVKEELRIRRITSTERYQKRVLLRTQEARVSRLPVETQTGAENTRRQ